MHDQKSDLFQPDWFDAAPPMYINFMNSKLVKVGLIDGGSPLPLYLYSLNPGSRNLMVFAVLGLWSTDRESQEAISSTLHHVQAHVRDKSIAPVVLTIPPGDQDNPACVIFGNNSEAPCLQSWLQDPQLTQEERLNICVAIARGVQILHENGVANLPIHARAIHVEDDNTVTIYPVGNFYPELLREVDADAASEFEAWVRGDMGKLHDVVQSVLGFSSHERCQNSELRMILNRLDQDGRGKIYASAGDLADDLYRYTHYNPINWIHTNSLARLSLQVRRHKKFAGVMGGVSALLILVITGLSFMTRQLRLENNQLTQRVQLEDLRQGDRTRVALHALGKVQASAEREFDLGNVIGSLETIDKLAVGADPLQIVDKEFSLQAGKVISEGRMRVYSTNTLTRQAQKELLLRTVRYAKNAGVWNWLLDQSGEYKEVLVAASEELSGISIGTELN
jgi:hypothetical protein